MVGTTGASPAPDSRSKKRALISSIAVGATLVGGFMTRMLSATLDDLDNELSGLHGVRAEWEQRALSAEQRLAELAGDARTVVADVTHAAASAEAAGEPGGVGR